jgi:hypothetical protein
MSTFSMKVHELLGLRTPVDRQTSLNVFEIDSKSPRRVERGSKQQIPPASSQDRWMVETATALAEFAVTAQTRELGVDRKTALDSMRLALESLCIGTGCRSTNGRGGRSPRALPTEVGKTRA